MKKIESLLRKEKYKKIKFKVTKTQHLLIRGRINGVKGDFILDTGASNSCVGFEGVILFSLTSAKSKVKAAGAGAVGMLTENALGNVVKLGTWQWNNFNLVVFDMSHVNEALKQHKAKPVHGIIGADVLLYGKAIIDYSNHVLYLKKG